MPTNRKRRTRNNRQRVTPQAVEYFKRGLELKPIKEGNDEYRDVWLKLHRELGLKTWHYSPLDLDDDESPSEAPEFMRERIEHVLKFRRELMEAIK